MTPLQRIAYSKSYLLWLGIFALIGALSTQFPIVTVLAFYYFYGISLFNILANRQSNENLDFMLGQLLGWEILARMADTSPWMPWETGKYVMFSLLLIGLLFKKGRVNVTGPVIILFSIPALLFVQGDRIVKDVVFNYAGILLLALSIMYFYQREYTYDDFKRLCRMMIYPIISILAFISIKTPEFDDLKFDLGANFQTTGGFGSNQVSTVLGLGMLLFGLFQMKNDKLFGSRRIDQLLLGYIAFRALISLSRGGVIAALASLGAAFLLYGIANNLDFIVFGRKVKNQSILNIAKLAVGGFLLFQLINSFTGNVLYLRYSGETAGTLAGVKEKNVSTITSGRYDVLMSDIEMWSDNFVFGVGVGNSKRLRGEEGVELAAHLEYSRLLSEHGLFGLFINFIILFYPIIIITHKRFRYNKYVATALLVIALITALHSAMRTVATPLCFGLALIYLTPNEEEDSSLALVPGEKETA